MTDQSPNVTVIIPTYNEERYIDECLKSIVHSDYPSEKLDIIVVDGRSSDGTISLVNEWVSRSHNIRLLENPRRSFPSGINIGITAALGELLAIMSAHSTHPPNYISQCVKFQKLYSADNVGGMLIAQPIESTIVAKSISSAVTHPFGAGNSRFKIGVQKPSWVDTVFGGCYKREVFDKIGLFDENLVRCSDIELNRRLRRAEGRILLVPQIRAYYHPKSSLLGYWNQTYKNGLWVTYPLKFKTRIFSLRHLVPLLFVGSVLFTGILSPFSPLFFWAALSIISLYFFTSLLVSSKIAWTNKEIRFLPLMPVVFSIRHIAYGIGSLVGIMKVLGSKDFWSNLPKTKVI